MKDNWISCDKRMEDGMDGFCTVCRGSKPNENS